MMGLINLGAIVLDGFEVPSSVEFGGKQRLVVHKLVGGMRVIDVLGRDDAALRWRGVLSGADAATRARTLDAMRVSGDIQPLTWNAFCYDVIVSDLRLSFNNPWWIPYDITCTVQQDLAQAPVSYGVSLTSSVVADLTTVNQLLGASSLMDVGSVAALIGSGSVGQQQALTSTALLQTTLVQGIANAEAGLASTDIRDLASSAGTLAQLCCAQGYLDRSAANISDMGS